MTTNTEELAVRLDRLESPRLAAEREAELSRLQAEAEAAGRRMPNLVRDLEVMRAERAAAERELTAAESALAEQRAAVARLGMREYPVERAIAACWTAIKAAADAGRPVPMPTPERRPLTVADARDRIVAWFRSWRDRPAKPKAPMLRADQYLAARVRLVQSCVCAGAGHQAGEVLLVPDSEVDVLLSNDRAVVLERRIVATRPLPAVGLARATRGTRGPAGESLAPGDVVPVDAATRDAIRDGRLTALELTGPDVEADRRIAAMQAQVAELEARFPQ